jgi:putative ubiquitin-RnfH superfamily antitoxin RatB of RatAB toxin-antitoxin module
MTVVRILAALLAALASALPLNCAAAPFTARLGIERLVIDTPPGFTDTLDLASPRLQDLADALTSASNRILIFALSDADVKRFTLGDQIEAKRYMIAVTPKALERERVTPEQFAALAAESLREFGKVPVAADFLKYLDGRPQTKPNLLLELKREPEVVSVLVGARLTPAVEKSFLREGKSATYLFSTTTLMLIHGRALQLSVYAGYEAPGDLDWLKSTTERWIGDLQRLNR